MADDRLAIALAFLNSRQLASIPDALTSVDAAQGWLRGDGYAGIDEGLMELVPTLQEMTGDAAPAPDELARSMAIRDALLDWVDGGRLDDEVLQGLRFEPDMPDGEPRLRPAMPGILALAAHAYLVLAELHMAGKSQRLRRCEADDCRWVFYDRSRNQSKVWCDMSGCGSRAKARAYRARQSTRTGR